MVETVSTSSELGDEREADGKWIVFFCFLTSFGFSILLFAFLGSGN